MELFVKILTNVFGNATIILGLVALFGCLLLRRKWTDTLLAVIKTMMGYEIVSAGAGLMGTAMTPLIKYIYRVLNAQGFVQNTWPAYSVYGCVRNPDRNRIFDRFCIEYAFGALYQAQRYCTDSTSNAVCSICNGTHVYGHWSESYISGYCVRHCSRPVLLVGYDI